MKGGIPFVRENALGNYIIDPDQISASLKTAEERIKSLEEEVRYIFMSGSFLHYTMPKESKYDFIINLIQ